MDNYNLQCLQPWFAHNKIKHEKFYARQFPEGYFRIRRLLSSIVVNDSQLAKMKKYIPHMSLP